MQSRRFAPQTWRDVGASDEIDFAKQVAVHIFSMSNMFEIDSEGGFERTLSYIGFVEAVARIAYVCKEV